MVVLLDGHGPLQLEQCHVVEQRFTVEVWMDDHSRDADFDVGVVGVVYWRCEIVVPKTDLQVPREEMS